MLSEHLQNCLTRFQCCISFLDLSSQNRLTQQSADWLSSQTGNAFKRENKRFLALSSNLAAKCKFSTTSKVFYLCKKDSSDSSKPSTSLLPGSLSALIRSYWCFCNSTLSFSKVWLACYFFLTQKIIFICKSNNMTLNMTTDWPTLPFKNNVMIFTVTVYPTQHTWPSPAQVCCPPNESPPWLHFSYKNDHIRMMMIPSYTVPYYQFHSAILPHYR